ncbi:MAG: alpha/beta hydrolase [Rhodocyclaceae bacterium]|nr:alpha/beta hydrolase [Rhodocyclaceae bacterium]
MKFLRAILLAGLGLLPIVGQAAGDNQGKPNAGANQTILDTAGHYPIPGSYAATILGTPPQLRPDLPKQVDSRRLALEVLPGLSKPEVFFYDEGLHATFAKQDKKAPLIFLIAGTGSNDLAGNLDTMMKAFHQAGFHVVTLPSPTHPNFIISASRSHIPGDQHDDAEDLYAVMEAAMKEVQSEIEVSNFYLAGYSLGGTNAAFVAKLDEQRKRFNFQKVLLINPAVNVYESVKRIEATLDGIPGGPKKIGNFFNSMVEKFTQTYRQGTHTAFDDNFLYSVVTSHELTQEEKGGLIGLSFRINSAGMIFASDVMTNGGYVVPKNRIIGSTDNLDDYFRVSVHLSFLQYFDEYFYPYFQAKRPGLTKAQLIDAQSLKNIENYLKSSTKIGAVTNENDFILSAEERDYLKSLFGDRTKIYPVGGHLGNLAFKDNVAYMLNFFKPAGDK